MSMSNIGHNSGSIKDRLSNLWGGLINRCQELINTAKQVPDRIEDDETAQKAADLIKLMKAAAKEADSTRKQENEPYAAAKQQVDAFFNIPKEAVTDAAKEVERRLSLWLQTKAAREEQQRRERAEAERLESERKFNDAIEADKIANAARESAAIAAATAAAARAGKEETIAAGRAARLKHEAAQQRARAAKAAGDHTAYSEAILEANVADAELQALEARVKELRDLERAADEKRKADEKAAKAAEKDVKLNMGEAQRSSTMADKLDRAADAKAADLSRTRGELGSVSSLRTDWVHDGFDRDRIDLEALRAHLPADAIDQAIRSFIRAGGRELRGTKIYEQTQAVVR